MNKQKKMCVWCVWCRTFEKQGPSKKNGGARIFALFINASTNGVLFFSFLITPPHSSSLLLTPPPSSSLLPHLSLVAHVHLFLEFFCPSHATRELSACVQQMPKFDTKKQPLMMHTRSKRFSAREARAARVKVTAPKRVRLAPLDQVKAEEPTTTTKLALELARDALAQQIQRSEVFWDEQDKFLQDAIDTAFPWSKREALMERLAHLHAQRSDFMNSLEEQHKRASIKCIKDNVGKFKALVPFVQNKPFALQALLEFIKRLE